MNGNKSHEQENRRKNPLLANLFFKSSTSTTFHFTCNGGNDVNDTSTRRQKCAECGMAQRTKRQREKPEGEEGKERNVPLKADPP
jgi:hypothetical protein